MFKVRLVVKLETLNLVAGDPQPSGTSGCVAGRAVHDVWNERTAFSFKDQAV